MSVVQSALSAALGAAFLLASSSPCRAQDLRLPKKLIETGWDEPDTERLLQNLEEMEKRPFDGVVVGIVGWKEEGDTPPTKKRVPLRPAFSREPWKREWFAKPIEDLKACKFRRFTDNFLMLGANPGNVDWFDDEGWQAIVGHWRIAAWIAKQSGLKGIVFDPEPYSAPHAQFQYSAQPQREKHTFAEYSAQARERGRQLIQAVADECPDLTLLCCFMNIACVSATGHADARPLLAIQNYGLYPAFVDGWLDAASPKMIFVDGCENAYRYNRVERYLESAVLIRGACQGLVSPENRAKYRAQVQVGFGVFLDAYVNPPTSPWHIDAKGASRGNRLRANVATALRVADQYVWVCGEKHRWWPTPNRGVKPETWPEALPGCEKALRFVRDPIGYAREQIAELAKAGKLANLVRDGDFGSSEAPRSEGVGEDWREGGAPAGWYTWEDRTSRGAFTWDRETGAQEKGSARASSVANGGFLQSVSVRPGETYAVRAVRRLQGKGDAWLRIRWQTADGKWTAEEREALLYAAGPREAWREFFGVVEVPDGVGRLLFLLCISGQTSPADLAWFDDVQLVKLE
jgi:hypothetical protein